MQVSVKLSDIRHPSEEWDSLDRWLTDPISARGLSFKPVTSKVPGQMSFDVSAFVVALASAPAVVELVKCIKDWVVATRNNVEIEFETSSGEKFKLKSSNFKSDADIAQLVARLKESLSSK